MKLHEVVVGLSQASQVAGRYVVMVWDEADGFAIPSDKIDGFPRGNHHVSVDQATRYIKAYVQRFYANTKLYPVPKDDQNWTEGVEDGEIPTGARPVNNMVYGGYDPVEIRSGFDRVPPKLQQAIVAGNLDAVDLPAGFWLPDVQLWVTDTTMYDVNSV